MRFKLLLGLLLISTLGVRGSGFDSLRTEEHDGKLFIIHQIDPGETLYSIGRRYRVNVDDILSANGLKNSAIRSGQILSVPIPTGDVQDNEDDKSFIHKVSSGETLYGLSKKYHVTIDQIKKWNSLKSESLNIGQELSIGKKAIVIKAPKNMKPFDGAQKHYVQTGETLQQISQKRNVSMDSLMRWNNLRSDDLKIGQILWYRAYDRPVQEIETIEYFGRKVEKGIARMIEGMDDSDKYLALHKTLPTGTLLEVRNLMNNKKVFVRVIGQLPSTGLNQDVVIRLTRKSFKRLGILDARARVEITYYED